MPGHGMHKKVQKPKNLKTAMRNLLFYCKKEVGIILFALVMLTIGGFNVFTSIKTITGGKPMHQTETVLTWMYYKAFSSGKFGYSAALSFIIALVLAVLAVVQFGLMQRKEDD